VSAPVVRKIEYPFEAVDVGGCEAVMFFLKRHPVGGDIAVSADLLLPDGKSIDRSSPIMCPACGRFFLSAKTEWIRPRG
jgi:hypothetical protein